MSKQSPSTVHNIVYNYLQFSCATFSYIFSGGAATSLEDLVANCVLLRVEGVVAGPRVAKEAKLIGNQGLEHLFL